MVMNRVSSSWRGADFRRDWGNRQLAGEQDPQLDPAPDGYPTFPDKSTWPVIFPELPAAPGGGPRRPPQHPSKASAPKIPADQLPRHVAVVMDGNGRWATQRGLHRTEGHKMGEAVLIDITCGAIEIGIKHLTVYAFSTENWKRSPEEVRFLMGFNREVVRRRRENLNAMGVRMRWVGSRPRMWRSVIKEFEIAENMTVDNDVITINYCVNYGGRTEIAEAAKTIAQEAAAGRLKPDRVSESTVARHLHRPDIPDVDLFIRTSGEQRASNFMLWQAAYAEFVFQDKLWPDYDRRDLWEACEEYVRRNRRFGRA
jgi:trans,polycis-decaprenyl diphosphate synthase